MATPTPTTLLRTVQRQPGEACTHPAIRSTGPGKWQCVLCSASLTDLDLIDQRNERRAVRWQEAHDGQ